MTDWHWIAILLSLHDFIYTWGCLEHETHQGVRTIFKFFGPIGFLWFKVSNVWAFAVCWFLVDKLPFKWRPCFRAALITVTLVPAAITALNNTLFLGRLMWLR